MSYSDNDLIYYNSIPNMTTDSEFVGTMRLRYGSILGNYTTKDDIIRAFNVHVSYPTIKRACCLGNADGYVDVQIPMPVPEPSIINDPGSKLGKIYKKYNMYTQSVKVPKGLCNSGLKPDGDWTPGSDNCDLFYEVFCKNNLDRYLLGLGDSPYSAEDFNIFQPDCACFGYVNKNFLPKNGAGGIPPSCYMRGCTSADQKRIYPDRLSRNTTCEATFCNILNNMSNVNAKDINYNQQISLNCGNGTGVSNASSTNNDNNNPTCIGVDTQSTNITKNLMNRITNPLQQIPYDISTFQTSLNSGGIMCAVKNHVPLMIIVMVILCCVFMGFMVIAD